MPRREEKEEESNKITRLIYTIYEGLTERKYFEYFNAEHSKLGLFAFEEIPKESLDRDQTDRGRLVDMMEGFVVRTTEHRFTVFELVSSILKDASLQLYGTDRLNERQSKSMQSIRNKAITDSRITKLAESNRVRRENIEDVIDLVSEHIRAETHNKDFVFVAYSPDDYNLETEKEVKNPDQIVVVIDRDADPKCPEKRTEKEYRELESRCRELKYHLLISTPMFEFWLLMHHEDTDYRDYDYDLSYKIDIAKALNEHEGRAEPYVIDHGSYVEIVNEPPKNITPERFRTYYKASFPIAVSKSKYGPNSTDFDFLLNNPGSNVGVFLESLLK